MMASADRSERNCFTLIWKVENVSYWWSNDFIKSPEFTVNEISWRLLWELHTCDKQSGSEFYVERLSDYKGEEDLNIDFEFALLSSDGKVLHSFEQNYSKMEINSLIGPSEFPSWYDVFVARRSVFLAQDTLTVRCRMWKSDGEISKNVHCVARTRIAVEKRSYLWNIEDFSNLKSDGVETFEINSLGSGEKLMALELFLTGGQITDETIRLRIIPTFNIKSSNLQVSVVDVCKNTVKSFLCEFHYFDEDIDNKEFTLIYTKRELLELKNTYLPNNVLSLLCECTSSSGKIDNEIEFVYFNYPIDGNPEQDMTNDQAAPKSNLINDLKSMLNNTVLADVKLKTRNKTYPAHKLILRIQSPVFKAIFSSDMKENITDCVVIDDISDETVEDMLRYIYCADVEQLEWGRAIQLYEAADKYQIINLKDICASYLKSNLRPNNACEALVLADLHQDEDLKRFVQNFILKDGEKIVNSDEWGLMMETHIKLAAETMRLKFKELVN